MNTNHLHTSHHQRGNVLFYILIAVALLAALSYAISGSIRSGGSDALNDERAGLYAAELIEYANIVSNATAQLRLRGCSETTLNYYHVSVAGHVNAGAPGDNSCDIFHINGGGVARIAIPAEITDPATTPNYIWTIMPLNEIEGVGLSDNDADSADLIMVADYLKQSICIKINDLLGVSNPSGVPPTDTNIRTNSFTGSYTYINTIGDEDSALLSRTAACFMHTTAGRYAFYKVLLAR